MTILENPNLTKPLKRDTPLKHWLVEYVGDVLNPPNNEVTVEHIIEVVAKEFPEFLGVLAEENFLRGYKQALEDKEKFDSLPYVERDLEKPQPPQNRIMKEGSLKNLTKPGKGK